MRLAARTTNAPDDWSPFTKKTVSVLEAAEAIGVSKKTIWRMCAEDRILFTRSANGRLRIYRESLFTRSTGNVVNSAQSGTSGLPSEHREQPDAE